MQLYKVKLLEGHNAKRGQIFDGYLGHAKNEPCLYTRGEALKKARMFKGKIEPHGKNYTAIQLTILQISRKDISAEVLLELDGREAMKDDDANAPIYLADVFDDILGENEERPLTKRMSFDAADEVYTLRELTGYVTYIMLAD